MKDVPFVENPKECNILVAGLNAFICDKCIEQANIIIKDEVDYKSTKKFSDFKIFKPLEIKKYLDQYVIGQDQAKKFFLLLFTIIIKNNTSF